MRDLSQFLTLILSQFVSFFEVKYIVLKTLH